MRLRHERRKNVTLQIVYYCSVHAGYFLLRDINNNYRITIWVGEAIDTN